MFNETKSKSGILHIESTNVPYDIKVESISPFNYTMNGWNYSYVGVRMYLHRNNLGLLIGSFFGVTAIFSILSLLSYNVPIEKVNKIRQKRIYFFCEMATTASRYFFQNVRIF